MQVENEQNLSVKKPVEIIRAVQLLYVALGIGVVGSLIDFAIISFGTLIIITAIFVFFLFLVNKISVGKDWARVCIFIFFLFNIPLSIASFFFAHKSAGIPAEFTFVVTVAAFGIFLFLINETLIGKGWAQVAFIVLLLCNSLLLLPSLLEELKRSTLLGVLSFIQSVLQVIALYLLTKKNATLWFKKHKYKPDTL